LSYPELWRQKQRELPVKGNPDAGWLQMRSLLDTRMPATGVTKKPFRLKLPKTGLYVLAGLSFLAAVYVGSRLYFSKQHPHRARPHIHQIRRDSVAPAVNQASPTPGADAPATATGTPMITPVISGNTRLTGRTRFNNDTAQKRGQQVIDSIKAPAILIAPIRRDSLVLPMEAVPLKPLRDSAGIGDPGKKDLQKDTSKTPKKTPKKKRRSKFSIFF
jgi:hypothetical protein